MAKSRAHRFSPEVRERAVRVWQQLLRDGQTVARCTVARLMAAEGLRGVVRVQRLRTTIADTTAELAQDLVQRHFHAERANHLWGADFTYVATWRGFVYVAFVIDAFSRRLWLSRRCLLPPQDPRGVSRNSRMTQTMIVPTDDDTGKQDTISLPIRARQRYADVMDRPSVVSKIGSCLQVARRFGARRRDSGSSLLPPCFRSRPSPAATSPSTPSRSGSSVVEYRRSCERDLQ